MEGSVNVLKELQSVIQRGLTNFKKSPKERLTIEYAETRQELLENDWALFKVKYTSIHEQYKAADVTQLVQIYDITEDTYITYKCLLKSWLNKYSSSKEAAVDKGRSQTPTSSPNLVKLPKISIPKFSGRYSEWTTFRDLFVSLVHNNQHLDSVQTMHYLKTYLIGEAEQLVRHTPISETNYIQCWAKLEKRYNNKKYQSNAILKRLFAQKRMHSESANSLKELLDTTTDCLSAFNNLGVDVSTWDIIIIHILSFKLDNETRKQWELHVSTNESDELPTFKQFSSFIESRFRAFENIDQRRALTHQSQNSYAPKALIAINSNTLRCEYCSEEHKLCYCKAFAKQAIDNRRDFVAKNKICYNCLGSNHTIKYCKKQTSCRMCKKRHHSLLHLGDSVNKVNEQTDKQAVADIRSTPRSSQVVSCFSKTVRVPGQVLLATALVKAESKSGEYHVVRALLDQGSQACFITESTVQYLRLLKTPVQGIISGLGREPSLAKHMVSLKIRSRVDVTFELNINAYVLNKITSYLPDQRVDRSTFDWADFGSIKLADPQFDQPNRIDLLLGAEVHSCILNEAIKKNASRTLMAQSTTLGWILSGAMNKAESSSSNKRNITVMHAQFKEDELLKQFWEIEEKATSTIKLLTPEEQRCEELYTETTKRREDGRYVVRLPFKSEDPSCKAGNSRAIAENRFKALERRLQKNTNLKEQYTEVIREYRQLEHMKPVKENDNKKNIAVYLPHHAVIREDKSTTRVRVVFNASEKNTKGISLNDTLMVGPTLQADLRHIVLRWRTHYIALVADVIKMYRQVCVSDEDTMFQRILWRDDPTEEIKDYELVTVTFGTASAPYQAVRTLHQVAYDEGELYPLASDKVLNSFYMDDLMTGCSNEDEAIEIYTQMTDLLRKGGFSLQKWNSNNQRILDTIKSLQEKETLDQIVQTSKEECKEKDKIEISTKKSKDDENRSEFIEQNNKQEIDIKIDSTMKILGLTWNRSEDCFQYKLNLPPLKTAPITKRLIISDIARLFDPLGWLAPSVVTAKIFIQKLWLAGVGWDEQLSNELVEEWVTYRGELTLLAEVQIPRWLGTTPGDDLELHGFCDASKAAYAAVIYLRKIDKAGNIRVSLLVAKSRVAPIKQISIPRLELSGAVLLTRLLIDTGEVLNIPKYKMKAWTDSTVVLAWLSNHPSKWKTFVANRTSEILSALEASQWFHVSTKENPADCASRGVSPSAFVKTSLWFTGPQFLKESTIKYNRPKDLQVKLEQSIKSHVATIPDSYDIFDRFSSLKRLLRVIAYCQRFLTISTNKGTKNTYLRNKEIDNALECCIKRTQRQIFTIEIDQLQQKGYLSSKTSKLKSLCPYLDSKSIMRVQGRLEKAPLDEQVKHPIVLPATTQFTHLLVLDAHHKTLHGGPQLMMNFLRTGYWIIGVRNMVKLCVRQCVTCAKQRANTKNPMMGSLPSIRCSPARPFLHSGVDYAGPISIRTTKGRGHRSYKGYICIFVCMSTRAIHLEVVSDVSSQAFLAAFRRFVSRRGHCIKLFSDNGTTFVGANRELQEIAKIQSSIAEQLETNGTEWHFIPPHAPNFGGLWEASVKSTKFHLRRVIGESTLTYEELSTFLSQVEACLNSRPISVINVDDPGEPTPLTPGHFLIGEPILAVPDYNHESTNVSSLTRWQFVQRMLQSFWSRWSNEYLVNLMNRYKWSSKTVEPKVGDVVLVKEDDLPPSRWLLGRIVDKHPGHDNVTRVVTLRTKSSTIKRPTNKICILPVET